MWFRSIDAAMGNQIGDGLAISANNNGLVGRLDRGKQAGEVCFGLVNIDSLHSQEISPVSPLESSLSCHANALPHTLSGDAVVGSFLCCS